MTTFLARHPETGKPELPYVRGATFNVQEHKPNPLFNRRMREYATSTDYQKAKHDLHPSDLCYRYPPSSGEISSQCINLRVSDAICIGDGRRSQIVAVDSQHHSRKLVAKIYDPLYWDFQEGGINQFAYCDTNYRCEATVYSKLAPLYETVVPRYYGSWSITVPMEPGKPPREVRLILLELIYGRSLEELNPREYTRSQRQEIMAKVAYAETMLRHHKILHMDQHPRNFLYTSSPNSGGGATRIVVIDFEAATVGNGSKVKASPGIRDAASLNAAIERTWAEASPRESFEDWLHDIGWLQMLRSVVKRYDLHIIPRQDESEQTETFHAYKENVRENV